ncbi:MAG: NUDIX hydrolase [Candidatus Binatia bacterium]
MYAVARSYWFVVRPRVTGAVCLLVHEDTVLLIRNTYGRAGWTFPGGMLRRHEPPDLGVQREVQEEVGITVDTVQHLGQFTGRQAYRRDTVHVFAAWVSSPHVQIDPGEILEARWYSLTNLPPLSTYAQRALALWQNAPLPRSETIHEL